MRSLQGSISTGCPELDEAWALYAEAIVSNPGVLIPDTVEDLNWHAFLAHGFDMRGFRAGEFTGVDQPPKGFIPLRERGIGVEKLAALWGQTPIRDHLLLVSRQLGGTMSNTYAVLRSGGADGASLADALETFPRLKTNRTVRALLQNCAALSPWGFSFRRWLEHACASLGAGSFPPSDFLAEASDGVLTDSLERVLRRRIEQSFYNVGPALAAYMLSDWQLGLWYAEQTGVFDTFKLDGFHEQFVQRYGHDRIPTNEVGFAHWWRKQYPDLPPRIANECIWLAIEHGIADTQGSSVIATAQRSGWRWISGSVNTDVEHLVLREAATNRLLARVAPPVSQTYVVELLPTSEALESAVRAQLDEWLLRLAATAIDPWAYLSRATGSVGNVYATFQWSLEP